MTDAPRWASLDDGERVVWTGRPVAYGFLRGYLLTVVLLALAGVTVVHWQWSDLAVRWLPAGSLVALALLVYGQTVLSRRSLAYLVTNEAVYVRRGVLRRSVTDLRLDRIGDTSIGRSLLGRLFSYGHVELDAASTEGVDLVLEYVATPEEVLDHVSEGKAGTTGPLGPDPGSTSRQP
jgi:uncharacterized membrane protein YdbT with pleckstrin-like domain